jgi:hypothetical protein
MSWIRDELRSEIAQLWSEGHYEIEVPDDYGMSDADIQADIDWQSMNHEED